MHSYSRGAFIYFILAFNVLGYATLRLSSWINTQYAVNMRSRWKIPVIYLAGMSLFLLLNYGLLVSAKILAGAANPFSIQPRGWWMLITIWLVELVVLGLLLANRSTQKALRLQQRRLYCGRKRHGTLHRPAKPAQSSFSVQQPQHAYS